MLNESKCKLEVLFLQINSSIFKGAALKHERVLIVGEIDKVADNALSLGSASDHVRKVEAGDNQQCQKDQDSEYGSLHSLEGILVLVGKVNLGPKHVNLLKMGSHFPPPTQL